MQTKLPYWIVRSYMIWQQNNGIERHLDVLEDGGVATAWRKNPKMTKIAQEHSRMNIPANDFIIEINPSIKGGQIKTPNELIIKTPK